MRESGGSNLKTQTILRERRKQKGDRGGESQFSEDLQTLAVGQLCLAALWSQKPKLKT